MNVSALLAASAERVPDKPALLFRGRPVTYAQLEDAVGRTASALAGLGVGPGDRVGLLLGNVPEFVYALYGTFRAGAIAVPMNVMLTPEEVGYILADAGARTVVCEMGYLPTILAVRDRLAYLESVVVVAGPPVPPGTVSFEEIVGAAQAKLDQAASGTDDLAVLQYTSGTTANPKGAMLTHGNLTANLEQMGAVGSMRIAQDDVVLLVLPMFHIYALNVVLGMTLHSGATAVLLERFHPGEALRLIREHAVTVLPGAPPMYVAWLATGDAPEDAFSSVRVAVSGAAPLPPEVLPGFEERFGLTIWDSYGLTEAGPAVTTGAQGDRAVPGSIGLPLPGLEVRLIDEDGEDVEEGDPGEIVVRGPNVFGGYWGKEEDSRSAFLEGGWLRTGDVAVRDDEGYLYLVDRKKDLIIVSGFNVYPHEVEEVLVRHPDVEEAAVIGVPDPRTGETVKALVVPRQGAELSPDEVTEFAGGSLARFKVPRYVEVVPSLPKHVTGKVLRRALRGEELLGGTGSPGAGPPP
ncbi:MAG: long-chain fatty acid--CoA ligase [Actinobacteria bacterium]|nr:long-chain fatty acid--CoA ligase [Actinomycetota bacterium]